MQIADMDHSNYGGEIGNGESDNSVGYSAITDPGGYYDEEGNWISTQQGDEWIQAYDNSGVAYWYNNYTGVSQYEDPSGGY
jgi:hypothetical protein